MKKDGKKTKKWRREWELNPPEPVLQTVALAARPSRLTWYGTYYTIHFQKVKQEIKKNRKKVEYSFRKAKNGFIDGL